MGLRWRDGRRAGQPGAAALAGIRDPLDRTERRLDETGGKPDDDKHAANGVALLMTMPAGHVHGIDGRSEAVERKIGA